jgi:hypothetical protein
MYALMLNLAHDVKPEDITMYLNFIPLRLVGLTYVPETKWKQFETKRTKQHLARYKSYLLETVEAMHQYAEMRRLSTPARRPPVFNAV